MENKEPKLTDICRSFSYKLNTGNYESRDFFASRREEVAKKDAVKKSEELYAFCKDEVMKSVYAYQMENLPPEKTGEEEKIEPIVEPDLKNSNQGFVAKSDVEDTIRQERNFNEEEERSRERNNNI